MPREVVLGVDSSTQSTKVLALDLDSGEIVSEARAPHSGADRQDPRDWWNALRAAIRDLNASQLSIRGISVSGQQHGLVTLDADNRPVREAPLWNNTGAAPDAERLNQLADFATETGTRLVASITIAKLAELARTSRADLERTSSVALPHDYLNLCLTGELTTDRGDASGTGWWSPSQERVRRDLLALATGDQVASRLRLPEVLGPEQPAGTLSPEAASDLGLPVGIPVGSGTGDNMAAALGVGARPGEFVISLGTSGTAYAVSDRATADPRGEVCGFADATGRFLPLACMLNCTRVIDQFAALLGLDLVTALDLAGQSEPGAGGLLLLPYLDGERTPNLPNANGTLLGVSSTNLRPQHLIRAAVDGIAAGLAYCVEALRGVGIDAPRITLVGGGSRHSNWQLAVADATGLPVEVRAGEEHAARGAAIQAAAIVRDESVANVSAAWRPEIIAGISPRVGTRDAFRLDERRQLIEAAMASRIGNG